MPAPLLCGTLVAQAYDFPANEHPHCTYTVPSHMRLGPVLRKGTSVDGGKVVTVVR
jgi:hypothetical protein